MTRIEELEIVKEAMKQLDYVGVERQRMEDLLFWVIKQENKKTLAEVEKLIDEVYLDGITSISNSSYSHQLDGRGVLNCFKKELKSKLKELKT